MTGHGSITLPAMLALVLAGAPAAPAARAGSPGAWESHGPSTGGDAEVVAVAPNFPNDAYAAVGFSTSEVGNGLYRTRDGGDSWTKGGDIAGIDNRVPFQHIVVDPTNPERAYASVPVPDKPELDGVFRTVDGGASWGPAADGLPDAFVNGLVADPIDGTPLFAATGAGVYRSDDRGGSWLPSSSGLPDGAATRALATTPSDPDRLYVAVLDGSQWLVYRSDDQGSAWVPTGFLATEFVYALAVSPTDPGHVYAGMTARVNRTTDGGVTWTETAAELPAGAAVRGLVVHPSGQIHAATDGGLFRSTAGGGWSPVGGGFPAGVRTPSVAIAGEGGSHLYAATWREVGGVWRSTDGGQTWEDGTQGLPVTVRVRTGLATDPSRSGVVYAAPYTGSFAAVFRSADGGSRWRSAAKGIPWGIDMSAVVVDPKDREVLLAGGYANGVYRSTDGAKTWTKTGLAGMSVEALAFAPSNPQVAFAVGHASGSPAVFRSGDGGLTWSSRSPIGPPAALTDVVVDPTDHNVVYVAGINLGIYKSLDGGSTWLNITAGLPGLPQSLAIDPSDPDVVYAGVTAGGLYKSILGGIGWLPTGLLGVSVPSVVVDPVDTEVLYAAIPGDGRMVVHSQDGGQTWTAMNDGLDPSFRPSPLAIDADGTRLYGATDGRGVFSVTLRP